MPEHRHDWIERATPEEGAQLHGLPNPCMFGGIHQKAKHRRSQSEVYIAKWHDRVYETLPPYPVEGECV